MLFFFCMILAFPEGSQPIKIMVPSRKPNEARDACGTTAWACLEYEKNFPFL